MRLAILGFALAALAFSPAQAAWKEYEFKDLEVAKEFPSEPKIEKGVYKTPLADEAPQTVFSAVDGGISYSFTVVDFKTRPDAGANLVGEAASNLIKGKDFTYSVDDFPLYDKGTASVYGTILTIKKPSGEKTTASLFFNKGRLYIVKAVVAPNAPNKFSPGVARFLETIRFHMAGYGFDYATGHDFPIGDDRPGNRDNRVIPGYVPPPAPLPAISKK